MKGAIDVNANQSFNKKLCRASKGTEHVVEDGNAIVGVASIIHKIEYSSESIEGAGVGRATAFGFIQLMARLWMGSMWRRGDRSER